MVDGWALLKVSKSKIAKPVDVDDYGSVASKHYNKREAPEFIFWDCLRKSQTNKLWLNSKEMIDWKLIALSYDSLKLLFRFFLLKIFDIEYTKKNAYFSDSLIRLPKHLKGVELSMYECRSNE